MHTVNSVIYLPIFIFSVKPCYQKFKATLNDALEHVIIKTTHTDSIIMVDELLEKVTSKYPEQAFERGQILSFISKTYGRRVEYMGKKKRYLFLDKNLPINCIS